MTNGYPAIRDFDRLTSAVFGSRIGGPQRMPMDLYRSKDEYVLNAELPGILPSSVDVDVDGQLLTIRAERSVPSVPDVKWLTRERESATFVRQLNLGQGVDSDGITADYRNGVLTVKIPVSEKAKPRKIAVTSDAPVTVDGNATGGAAHGYESVVDSQQAA